MIWFSDTKIIPLTKYFGVKLNFVLAYCLYIRAISKESQGKICFAHIDSNAEAGPAFLFAICHENGDAMQCLEGVNERKF